MEDRAVPVTIGQLHEHLAAGGRPAGPPPLPTSPARVGGPIEVDRSVSANGLVGLAGRQHPIGYHFAGQRVTLRLDGGLLQIVAAGVLLRSLPNPLRPHELSRIRDARPAGPRPQPAAEPVRVQRRVSARGGLAIAGQPIHLGLRHSGITVTVEDADHTFRIYHHDQLLAEVARTTTKPIARFKVRKPEPARRSHQSRID